MTPTLEITIIILLILANGVLALTETAFVSVRKARLQEYVEKGDARAKDALNMTNNLDHLLATLEFGMALISTLSGVFSGAVIAQWVASLLNLIPWLAPYSASVSLALVVIVITYFTLVIGSLVPERLALGDPERIASMVARSMRVFERIATPFSALLDISTKGVLRLIGWHPSTEPSVSEGEISILIEQGTQSGVFVAEEKEMIERVFRLRNRMVSSVMVRHPDMVWLDVDKPRDDMFEIIQRCNYSRFPVCRGSLDNVLGIVRVKDLFLQRVAGQTEDIQAILKEPVYVFERTSTLKVLEMFKTTGANIALVVQEDGSIQGMITLYDLLREIVGDISFSDDGDKVRRPQRDGKSWIFDGACPIDELKETLRLSSLPNEKQGGYETTGGMILVTLGHIPQEGETLEWSGYHFEVKQVEERRVKQLVITPLA